MSCFVCSKCGCMENTAMCGYSYRGDKPALCSECDPAIGKWHGIFNKKKPVGYLLGSDGYIYHKNDNLEWRKKNQGLKLTEIK